MYDSAELLDNELAFINGEYDATEPVPANEAWFDEWVAAMEADPPVISAHALTDAQIDALLDDCQYFDVENWEFVP